MKLKEVFDQLTYGELSQIGLGILVNDEDDTLSGISIAKYPAVLSHINLGLLDLYKRFPLKEKTIQLSLKDNVYLYLLNSNYAVNTSSNVVDVNDRYIVDTVDRPFKDDLLKIQEVKTVGLETVTHYTLNDRSDPYGVMTPSSHELFVPMSIVDQTDDVPEELRARTFDIVYRATAPVLSTDPDDIDLNTAEVELPYTHLNALLMFIAARVHTPTGMMNETNMGNTYAAKYEQACENLKLENMGIDQGANTDRLRTKGFV